ncbi:MAG: site-2 protease family protein [Ignavibacteria bacterium]|nr:site-2 protease family protein [Ignavibacteria bacterium]
MKEFEFLPYRQPRILKRKSPFWVHFLLFLVTFVSTMIAGTQWAMKNYLEVTNWHFGLTYAILIMTFLLSHEMGHYIASRIHKVEASLPYFIPSPLPDLNPFGTFGALIATRSPIPNRKVLFDIGISGPLAGFLVSLVFIIYGLINLPPKEYIYSIHPEYLIQFGGNIPQTGLHFGDSLIFSILTNLFANPNGWLPPMNEIYHYPFLCVGWFGLFVTILNLLPFGQLDGGHIIYAMFGNYQWKIAKTLWWVMLIFGLGSILNFFLYLFQDIDYPSSLYIWLQDNLLPLLKTLKSYFPFWFDAWGGWLFWAVFTKLFIRIPHPYIPQTSPLNGTRLFLGYVAIIVLILSFTPNGIYFK